jgi:LysR family transcriptional regulator, glycine cleavage system transcriptional activator
VTAGAASLQVRALEEYLGRELFRRNGRHVVLTSEGAALLPRVQQTLSDLERAIDDTRGDRADGPLQVSMLSSFLQNWLLPRLPRLRAHHPGVDLQVHTSAGLVDFVRSEQHAAVRFGMGTWPYVTSDKLLDEWLVPVCTPELLARHGRLRKHGDVARYPLVHSSSEPWTAWLLAGERSVASAACRLRDDNSSPFTGTRIDDSAAVVRLATQGGGLALARWSLAADEIAAGGLVVASDRPLPVIESYWLVYPKRCRDLKSLQRFREWLEAEIAAFPPPPGA